MASPDPAIRTHLEPGDLEAIARLHGECYAAEHSLDGFEAFVADGLAAISERGWPAAGHVWIVHRGRTVLGSVALTDEGNGLARLRFFILHPAERGSGLGRRLLGRLLATAAAEGYSRVELVTFGALLAAGRLYVDAGFRCVRSARERHWGRELEMQRYELELDPAAARGTA